MTDKIPRNVKPMRKPRPGILWHYTTIDVIEHFLKGEISFSHYKFLNDDSELSYGMQLLRDISESLNSEDLKKFIWGGAVEGLLNDAYLFCLSRDGDNLYQWRSYTQNGGVAVGFSRSELCYAIQEGFTSEEWSSYADRIKSNLLICGYRDDFARRVVLRLKRGANVIHLSPCGGGCKGLGMYIEKMRRVVLSQKNPSFREEQEERFVVTGVPRELVSIINGKPRIAICSQDVSKSISCVRLSPHGDKERNRLFVEILRDKYKLDFKIEQSYSSYNGR